MVLTDDQLESLCALMAQKVQEFRHEADALPDDSFSYAIVTAMAEGADVILNLLSEFVAGRIELT